MKELIVITGFMVAVLAANIAPEAEADAPPPENAASGPHPEMTLQAG
ncbi:hypothetical protein [Pseudooceanicola sp.]